MKIIQVIDSLRVGGAQKLMVVFAREMIARNHTVKIITLSRPEQNSPILTDLQELDIEISMIPLRSLVDLDGLKRVSVEMRRDRVDIVHTQLNYANVHGTLAAKMAGVPAVASLHNASVHLYSYKPYRTWLETIALDFCARRIIACGHTVARVQQHRFGNKKLVVIPNPVPDQPPVSSARRTAIRRELLRDDQEIMAISVGRLIPEKGYSDLIRVIQTANRQAGHPIRLFIVGGGYLLEELQNEVMQSGQENTVRFLGERDDVPQLLAASDIYISGSHYEGQSLAVLEAMSSGLPVVVTDVGDNRHIISEERGRVLPSGSVDLLAGEIVRLAGDPQERQKLGGNARTFVQRDYSPAIWVDRLLDLYNEVLGG